MLGIYNIKYSLDREWLQRQKLSIFNLGCRLSQLRAGHTYIQIDKISIAH